MYTITIEMNYHQPHFVRCSCKNWTYETEFGGEAYLNARLHATSHVGDVRIGEIKGGN